MRENPLKNGLKVLTFKPSQFAEPVTVGVASRLRLPLLEQCQILRAFNEGERTSLGIISPALADACLASPQRGFFAEAGRFLTSGIVFYPATCCQLYDSLLKRSTDLSFDSGKRVFMDSGLFNLSEWGCNDALMIADISKCGFSTGPKQIRITSIPQDPIRVQFPRSSAWYETYPHHSWAGIPTGKFSGNLGDVKGTPASGLRLFMRSHGSNAVPIIRAAQGRDGAVVYLDSDLTEATGMVVAIPREDAAKFARQE